MVGLSNAALQVTKLTGLKEQYENLVGEPMVGQKPTKKFAKKLKAEAKAKAAAGGGQPKAKKEKAAPAAKEAPKAAPAPAGMSAEGAKLVEEGTAQGAVSLFLRLSLSSRLGCRGGSSVYPLCAVCSFLVLDLEADVQLDVAGPWRSASCLASIQTRPQHRVL